MLAQRFIAICDHDGCNEKTKATVLIKVSSAVKGLQHPIVLQPTKFVFEDKGWSFAWNSAELVTELFCSSHGSGSEPRKKRKRNG